MYLEYRPHKDWTGTDRLAYAASDGVASSAEREFELRVTGVADLPQVQALNVSIRQIGYGMLVMAY